MLGFRRRLPIAARSSLQASSISFSIAFSSAAAALAVSSASVKASCPARRYLSRSRLSAIAITLFRFVLSPCLNDRYCIARTSSCQLSSTISCVTDVSPAFTCSTTSSALASAALNFSAAAGTTSVRSASFASSIAYSSTAVETAVSGFSAS